jgi:copper homeostasis protein
MIRPRAGDFVYSEQEVQTMCEDIREFKAAGATGFVLGSLNASDGSINEGYMSW